MLTYVQIYMYDYVLVIISRIISLFIMIFSGDDLLKMYATFWGGVEVACRILRKVIVYFRKQCAFAPFFCAGTTPLGFSL